jgi:hypothetical protein
MSSSLLPLAFLLLVLFIFSSPAQSQSDPSSVTDLFVPDSCNSIAQLHDHVMVDIQIEFANKTRFNPSLGTFQLIHAKLDNIEYKPILRAIKGMCKNSTRELRFESGLSVNFDPFSEYFSNEIFALNADESVSVIIRVDSITTTTDFQIFDVIQNKDIGKALDLLEAQIGINAVDQWGQSALMLAVSFNIIPIVAGLINAKRPKIDINYAKPNGKTAIFYVLESKDPDSWLLNAMLRRGAEPNVKLISEGASGNTPLHYACLLGKYQHAEILLEYGADPNATNEHGQMPMHLLRDLTPSVKSRLKTAFEAAFQKQSTARIAPLHKEL